MKLFVNGTLIGTTAITYAVASTTYRLQLGYYSGGPASYLTGYIDDLRITKGVARYTANFTPPASAFPNQ